MRTVIRLIEDAEGHWYCHRIQVDCHSHVSFDEAEAHAQDLVASCPSASVVVQRHVGREEIPLHAMAG